MPRYKPWSCILSADDLDDVFAVEVSCLSEECLNAIVMIAFVDIELSGHVPVGTGGVVPHLDGHVCGVDYGPSSEGSGALFMSDSV